MLVSPGFHPGAAARFLPEVRNANLVACAQAHLGADVRQGTLLTEHGAPRRSPGLYLALLAEVRPPLSGLAVAPAGRRRQEHGRGPLGRRDRIAAAGLRVLPTHVVDSGGFSENSPPPIPPGTRLTV